MIVDPYFDYKFGIKTRAGFIYREAAPHEDPFDRGRGWAA